MAFRIIGAAERMAEKSGVKGLVLGPYGIGKTSLLRTLDAASTLFVDAEAGDLAVQDVAVDTIRPQSWAECRAYAAFIGGPNPSLPAGEPYSQAHYDWAVAEFAKEGMTPEMLGKYDTIFVDSITKLSRHTMTWAKQQPDAFSEKTGKPDTRGAYGLLGREMIAFVTQLQMTRAKNVIFTCAMEQSVDDYGAVKWVPHIEGSKAGREMPGIVDLVISYSMIDFGNDRGPMRAFVTALDNPHGMPAKDRSGRLQPYEPPHLGKLIEKASNSQRRTSELQFDTSVG